MCGILGIASLKPVRDRAWLSDGLGAMRHRGPDDGGEWWSDDWRVGLGHRRLAVIDVSAAAHQPMLDGKQSLAIVFNGEIYNFSELRQQLQKKGHTFHSHSDTEVILEAYQEWGTDCLSRLKGMFAFAIFDINKKQVFLARDRVGEKPLFYAHDDHAIRFASELKGMMADPAMHKRMDPKALDCYLAMGYVPGDMSILRGVKKLPPAHALIFNLDDGSNKLWRYWHMPQYAPLADKDETYLIDKLESLLEDSVRRQMVADVPIGVLLSGGVDSSLIAALSTRVAPKVKTFTIRFPGYDDHDETAHARLIANHFETQHTELDASSVTVDLLPALARQFDEPMADSSMIPTYLVSQMVRQHCTVVLGGDGGDELFGGYNRYNHLLAMAQGFGRLPGFLRSAVVSAAEMGLPVGFPGRNRLQGYRANLKQDLPISPLLFDRRARKDLISKEVNVSPAAERIHAERTPHTADLVQRSTRMDFTSYLPEDILVKVDRASMMNSLEVRAPFLDLPLIEFAFGDVPSHLKVTRNRRKILLKKLAARLLPPGFDQSRKQGLSIPLGDWLKEGAWRDFFHDVLLSSDSTLFDRAALQNLIDGQARGRSNSERLFALLMLELWRRNYDVSI